MGRTTVWKETTMHLSAYYFEGDPATLAAAHDEMTAKFPPDALPLHLCVRTSTGITVFDACPTKADAEAFRNGPEFAAVLADVGLPTPRYESVGEITSTVGVS
jgi:hypothetical protein